MADASALAALTSVLGIIGTVCFAVLLMPQARLNYVRKSTEGLSAGLVVLWHAAAVLYAGFLIAAGAPAWLTAALASFMAMCALLEAQIVAYRQTPLPLRIHALVFGLWTAAAAVTTALVCAVWQIVLVSSVAAGFAIGTIAPAALFGAAFLPQIWLFVATCYVEGYSFIVSAIDATGCIALTSVLVVDGGASSQSWVAAVPLVVIAGMHGVMAIIAVAVLFCPCGRRKEAAGAGGPFAARATRHAAAERPAVPATV